MASAITYGLILLGNSGVGKSFLANRLLNDNNAFESRFSAKSVTRHTEWKDMIQPITGYTYSVANIPGLVEADQHLVDENCREIMQAIEKHSLSIIIFVFGHRNGRIPDEDLAAFIRINDAYDFAPNSIMLVVNGIPPGSPEEYEIRTIQLLCELTGVEEKHICFIPKINSRDYNVVHDYLCEEIEKCQPGHHRKKHDILLITDEIAQLKAECKQRQDKLLKQAEEYARCQMNANARVIEERTSEKQQVPPTESVALKQRLMQQNEQFNQWLKDNQQRMNQSAAEMQVLQQQWHRNDSVNAVKELQEFNDNAKALLDTLSCQPETNGAPKRRFLGFLRGLIFTSNAEIKPTNNNIPCGSTQDEFNFLESHEYKPCSHDSLPIHPYNPRYCKH